MNPLAIEIYAEHDIDIGSQPLRIDVCAQHQNGGFVVDKWWRSSIPGTFIIGEMAGTHGVKRPGGSALNAGQVGGYRAAEYIVHSGGGERIPEDPGVVASAIDDFLGQLHREGLGVDPCEAIVGIQRAMSRYGGHIRNLKQCKLALEKAQTLYNNVRWSPFGDNPVGAIRARHLALSQIAFLQAIVDYIENGGGSRGSYMVADAAGDVVHPDLVDPGTGCPLAFIPENETLRETIAEVELESPESCTFRIEHVRVRPIPQRDEPFEVAWARYRGGEIYGQDAE